MAKTIPKICQMCEKPFRGRRDAKTCSSNCRKRLQRARNLTAKAIEEAGKLGTAAELELQHLATGLFPREVAYASASAPSQSEFIPSTDENLSPGTSLTPDGQTSHSISVDDRSSEPVSLTPVVGPLLASAVQEPKETSSPTSAPTAYAWRWGVLALLLLLITGFMVNFLAGKANHNRLGQLNNLQQQQGQRQTRLEGRVGRLEVKVASIDSRLNALKVATSNATLAGNSFNGPNQLVQLTDSGSLPTLNGANLSDVNAITLGGNYPSYYTNASNINSGTLSDSRLSGNVALLNAANTFTGSNTFASLLAANLTLGIPGTTVGSLNLANATSTREVVLQGLNPSGSGNATVQLPTIAGGSTDTVCLLTLGNCVGAGGAVSTTGGVQNFITKYNNAGANQLTNSELYDNGSGVSLGNTSPAGLFNVGAANQFQVSSGGAVTAVGLNSGSGLIQGTGGLTIGGTTTLSSLNSAGVLHTNGSGVLSTSSVVLGADTTGNYVANLGSLTGLTTGGNSGAGSTPSLSVNYGSGANTAVQGNTTFTCASGTGNLTGGGTTITEGSGGSCASINTVNSPAFSGAVTLGIANTSAGSLVLNNVSNSHTTTLQGLANGGQNQTITIPASTAVTDTVCLATLANCTAVGAAGGDLTGSYPNPTIAKLQGSTLTLSSPSGGQILQYNGSAFVNQTLSGDVTINSSGVTAIGAGKVTNTDLVNNSLTVSAGTGLSGGGSVALGGSTSLSVQYGSSANTAVQGNTTFTCASGTGNLTGGGTTITEGSGGSCASINTVNSPVFSGTVTVQGANALTLGTASTNTGAIIFQGSGGAGTLTLQGPTTPNTGNFTLSIPAITASANLCTDNSVCSGYAPSSGSGSYIQNGTSIQTSANFAIQSAAASSVGAVIQGAASQTADLLDLKTSTPATVLSVSASGAAVFENSANSTTAFQIQNQSGASLLTADTSNTKLVAVGDVNVGNRFGSRLFSDNFEDGSFNFWDKGTGGAITIDTTTVHDGKYAAKMNPSSGSAFADASISPSNTAYLRAWVDVTSQTSANADLLTLCDSGTNCFTVLRNGSAAHIWNNVTGTDVGSGGSFTTSTWHLIEMRITVGSGTGVTQLWFDGTQVVNLSSQNNGTNPLSVTEMGNSNARTSTAYVDDVAIDTASTGTPSSLNVDDSLHVGGSANFNNDVSIQSTSNNANAFEVQDAAGNYLLNVDTAGTSVNIDTGGLYLYGITSPTATLTSSGSGGTLGAGTYYYRMSAYNANGLAGAVNSSPASVTTTGSTSENTLTWTAVPGATGYYVYRSTNNINFYRNDVGNVTTVVDNGSTYSWSGTDRASDNGFNDTASVTLKQGGVLNFDNTGNASFFENTATGNVTLGAYAASQQIILQADSFHVEDTTGYNDNLVITNTGATTFKNRTNSTTAFQIQNQAGTSNLLVADTTDSRIGLGVVPITTAGSGLLQVGAASSTTAAQGISFGGDTSANLYRSAASTLKTDGSLIVGTISSGGTSLLCYNGSNQLTTCSSAPGAGSYIFNGTSTQTNANFNIQSASASSVAAIIQGASSQTADLLDLKTSTPATVMSVGATGSTLFQNSSNSTNAFQIQNAVGANILNIDTSTTSNLITNGDFEVDGKTGWSPKGSSTLSSVTAQAWQGNSSLQIATTTAAGDGAQYAFTFSPSTQYTLSLYGRVSSGSITDVNIGRQDNGSDIDCLTGKTFNTTWTRFSCTFTTGSTISGSNVYIKKTGSSAETLFIDGVQLQTGSTASGFNAGGGIQIGGVIESPLTVQNKANSANAFQVQNATGTNILSVSTSGLSVTAAVNTTITDGSLATIGSELMTSSESFPATTGWTSISGTAQSATATHTAGGGTTALSPTPALTITNGTTYQVSFAISGNPTAGESITPGIGGASGTAITGNDANDVQLITATGTGNLTFTPTNNWNGTITSVSVKAVTLATADFTTGGGGFITYHASGNTNVFLGVNTGQTIASGAGATLNVGIGALSSQALTSGSSNTALGVQSLDTDTTGNNNTAIGLGALFNNLTGSDNVALGYQAGYTGTATNANTTGSNNTFIGYNSGPGITTQLQNAAAIGTYAIVSQSNSLVLGCISGTNGCTTTTKVGIANASPGNLLSVGTLSHADSVAQLAVSTGATTNKGIVIQAVSSQSADILDVEDSSGNVLFGVSKTGHIITGGGALPGATPQTADGTTGTCTVAGDDTAGTVTITPGGTGIASGAICQINFTTAFASAPRPVIAATNGAGSAVQAYVSASATGSFTISFNTTPSAQAYTFNWFSPQ